MMTPTAATILYDSMTSSSPASSFDDSCSYLSDPGFHLHHHHQEQLPPLIQQQHVYAASTPGAIPYTDSNGGMEESSCSNDNADTLLRHHSRQGLSFVPDIEGLIEEASGYGDMSHYHPHHHHHPQQQPFNHHHQHQHQHQNGPSPDQMPFEQWVNDEHQMMSGAEGGPMTVQQDQTYHHQQPDIIFYHQQQQHSQSSGPPVVHLTQAPVTGTNGASTSAPPASTSSGGRRGKQNSKQNKPQKPKGTPGRKVKVPDYELTPQEAKKRHIRRERNKVAAAKCRNRRRELTESLQGETERLQRKYHDLMREERDLKIERDHLEEILRKCAGKCSSSSSSSSTTTVTGSANSNYFGAEPSDFFHQTDFNIHHQHMDSSSHVMSGLATPVCSVVTPSSVNAAVFTFPASSSAPNDHASPFGAYVTAATSSCLLEHRRHGSSSSSSDANNSPGNSNGGGGNSPNSHRLLEL